MNFKRFLAAVALVATSAVTLDAAAKAQSINTLVGRAFSTDMARELMAEQAAWTMNADSDSWHGTFQVVGQYNRNFYTGSTNGTGIGARPFWSGTNTMTVGNNLFGGTASQLDSYQFGLGNQVTAGSVNLKASLYNAGADFLFYVGAHQTETGFWGKINAAVGVASVNLTLTEPLVNTGTAYAARQMDVTGTAAVTPVLFTSLAQAWANNPAVVPGAVSAFQGLNFGKINGKQTSSAKFGDIDVAVGYNFVANDRSHLGVALRFTGPTGNKPASVYVLEPVWGNGGHWGLGGEVFGHATLWQGHDDRELQLWGDIQVQHLFKATQVRSYDLAVNGAGSKYLLVADFGTTGAGIAGFTSTNLVQQFINVSTLASNSTVGAEVDGALMLQYNCHNWQFDLGYNFAGKSKETLIPVAQLAVGRYGVLGHQDTIAAGATTAAGTTEQTFNMSTCSVVAAAAGGTVATLANNIQGNAALNVTGAAQAAGWSSKVFGQVAYRWNDSDYVPTLALQGSGEFSTSGNNALNQWSVGVRGGFSF